MRSRKRNEEKVDPSACNVNSCITALIMVDVGREPNIDGAFPVESNTVPAEKPVTYQELRVLQRFSLKRSKPYNATLFTV